MLINKANVRTNLIWIVVSKKTYGYKRKIKNMNILQNYRNCKILKKTFCKPVFWYDLIHCCIKFT